MQQPAAAVSDRGIQLLMIIKPDCLPAAPGPAAVAGTHQPRLAAVSGTR